MSESNMIRRITVFTGTRAEYGLLRRLIATLADDKSVDLSLLVSGTHLSEAYGGTMEEIKQDNFAPVYPVDIALTDNTPSGICHSMGLAVSGYARILETLSPDLLVVLGDRYESFCAVAAAAVLCCPVAHLGGGEISQGAIDELFRHAMTKMSHLHFVASETNRRRVIQMGEDPDRVWNVGSGGIENIRTLPILPEEEVRGYLDVPQGVPYILLTFHPATLVDGDPEEQLKMILEVLASQQDIVAVFTGANADSAGEAINHLLMEQAKNNQRVKFFMSLGVLKYLNAARYAVAVAGNSSSGLVEIPTLGTPVLDIGDRQKGRDRLAPVLHCDMTPSDLQEGFKKLLTPGVRPRAEDLNNPYDMPGTSDRIANVVATYPLDGILQKRFYDVK